MCILIVAKFAKEFHYLFFALYIVCLSAANNLNTATFSAGRMSEAKIISFLYIVFCYIVSCCFFIEL